MRAHYHLAINLVEIDALRNVINDDLHQFWGKNLGYIGHYGLFVCLQLSISHPWSMVSLFAAAIVMFNKYHSDYWQSMLELFQGSFDRAKEQIQNIGVIQALKNLWIDNELDLVFS